ncbi:condensation domain-containing protein, partial [Rhodococcus yananensis]|uniref:condensation domain-containing protein n=1 Tax=Rhodococcus yananensis TaxID=2879464 RepID=UPI003EBAE1E1
VASAGFDVAVEVPIRVRLLRVSEVEHVLVFVVHHIAADGFSMGPLTRDVMVAYSARVHGAVPGWAPLELQYADYAIWQRRVLGDEDEPDSLISRQLGYWQGVLDAAPERLDLPMDRPRPAVASNTGASYRFPIDAGLRAAVVAVAQERGVTPFMVVHAALAVVLARLSGTGDIAIGTPVAGRGEQVLDDLVGMFVNTLVLRTSVDSGESFEELLARTREVDLGAFAHADVPFERLVEVLDPVRSQSHHPLFQVVLAFQNLERGALELAGLRVDEVDIEFTQAKFDLQLTISDPVDGSEGYDAEFTFATDLFDRATVVSFAERFVRVLGAVVADPAVVVG